MYCFLGGGGEKRKERSIHEIDTVHINHLCNTSYLGNLTPLKV